MATAGEKSSSRATTYPKGFEFIEQLVFDKEPTPVKPKDIRGHRLFPFSVKLKCWEKAAPVPGRDPARWRMDPFGNPVLFNLRGCMGQFCHEYDHIVPFSKGGHTVLENCQILQTKVNRIKSNATNMSFAELKNHSPKIPLNEDHMDLIEELIYGDVKSLNAAKKK